MKRQHAAAILALTLLAAACAQQALDIAQLSATADAALRVWREGDPKLEVELGTVRQPPLEQRIRRAAEDAQKASLAMQSVADAVLRIARDAFDLVDHDAVAPDAESRATALKEHDAQLAAEAALLTRGIEVFAADNDPGIQKVRAAMERELAALKAVREAQASELRVLEAAPPPANPGESSRVAAIARSADLLSGAKSDLETLEREAQLWNQYYLALPQAAKADDAPAKPPPAPGTPRIKPGAIF